MGAAASPRVAAHAQAEACALRAWHGRPREARRHGRGMKTLGLGRLSLGSTHGEQPAERSAPSR
jgi:hypothetical protein